MMSLPLTLSADGSRCPRRVLLFLTSLALSFGNGRIGSAVRRPHRFMEGCIDGRALKIDGKRQVTPTMLHGNKKYNSITVCVITASGSEFNKSLFKRCGCFHVEVVEVLHFG